jgi:hypothetical protein
VDEFGISCQSERTLALKSLLKKNLVRILSRMLGSVAACWYRALKH